jgi:uncharacterized protein (DUF1778 family)
MNIRTTPRQEKLIELGAELRGTNVSNFVVESACVQAEHAIADKRSFHLNEKDWQAFMRALDAPPQSKPALRKLFSQSSVLERHP